MGVACVECVGKGGAEPSMLMSTNCARGCQVRAAIRAHGATVCFLPSPNNPTGTVLPNDDAVAILEEDCLLVVDEA
jgi:histidinol-phosphate/aromatic aminotransferase/cobyric acid decarboxylase-like protein